MHQTSSVRFERVRGALNPIDAHFSLYDSVPSFRSLHARHTLSLQVLCCTWCPNPIDAHFFFVILFHLFAPCTPGTRSRYRYSVVRGALDADQVNRLREWSEASAPVQALRHQYNQQCDPHRYEYLLFADHKAGAGLADAVKEALIKPVSAELETSESFCIVSEAGSNDQPWHTDSIPSESLSRHKWTSSLHYIGVLTPLADTDEVCGRTEVLISSHKALGNGATSTGRSAKLSLKVGDCLVLDGRTLHRGLANRSTNMRKLGFFTYKLPWVDDGNFESYSQGERRMKDRITLSAAAAAGEEAGGGGGRGRAAVAAAVAAEGAAEGAEKAEAGGAAAAAGVEVKVDVKVQNGKVHNQIGAP